MKVGLIASHGGHLLQLQLLEKAFNGWETFFITYKGPTASRLSRRYLLNNIGRNPLRLTSAARKIFSILLREKPDVLVSTGAEIAIPAFYLAKLLKVKTIFIESISRIRTPSRTGRIVYPITDLFLVQSMSLLEKYGHKAKFYGAVI